jgi:hypothetical protein
MEADTERTAEAAGPDAVRGEGDAEGIAAKFAEIESRLCQGYEDMLISAKEIGDVTSHHVRLHPLAACGLAFLAGITLARMLRR